MMNTQYIIKLANYFYSIAVPLEGMEVSPYQKEEFKDLPSLENFQEVFKNTTFNYRLIYLNNLFNLREDCKSNPQKSIAISDYKNNIQNIVNNLSTKSEQEPLSPEEKNTLDEGKYLLNESNFNRLFGKDSINIVVNKFDESDDISPQAVVHDIGHRLTDQFLEENKDFKSEEFYKNLTNAIKLDYNIELVGKSKGDIDLAVSAVKNTVLELLLVSNNIVSGSIAEKNLSTNTITDLLPDMLLIFNNNKESLRNIKPLPIIMYIDKYYRFLFLRKTDEFGKDHPIRMIPKNPEELPNIEKIINSYLPRLDSFFNKELNSLKGRVIPTWIKIFEDYP